MGRGVLYMVWGEGYEDALHRSILSVERFHHDLPCHVVRMPPDSTVLCKSQMFEVSPFEETLFLDADTVVMGNLDYGFQEAANFGIACCISANPWQRRYHGLHTHPDATEYSSGVVFFDKSHDDVPTVFGRWLRYRDLDSSTCYHDGEGIREQEYNDQALLTLAMSDDAFAPSVLPQNWNLSPQWQKSFFGPVKILHGLTKDSQDLERWNADQSAPGAVIRYARFAEEGE